MSWRARLLGEMEADERGRHTAELARLRLALRAGLAELRQEAAALRVRHETERRAIREAAARRVERVRALRDARLRQVAEQEAEARRRLAARRKLLRETRAARAAEIRQHRARLARAKRHDAERRRERGGRAPLANVRVRKAELAQANESNVLGARPELGAAWRAMRRKYMGEAEGWRMFLEWAEAHPEEVTELTDAEAATKHKSDLRALRRAERDHYRQRRADELAAVPF